MVFSQHVNIVWVPENMFLKLFAGNNLKKNRAYHYSPLLQSLQNMLFLVSSLNTIELSEWTTAWRRRDCCRLRPPGALSNIITIIYRYLLYLISRPKAMCASDDIMNHKNCIWRRAGRNIDIKGNMKRDHIVNINIIEFTLKLQHICSK